MPRRSRDPGDRSEATFSRAVATIGVYDGLHRGHQLIFHQVLSRAAEIGAAAIVVTFDPHPVEVFQPDRPHERVQSPGQKKRLLLEMGFRGVVELVFSREMAAMSPGMFVRDVLSRHMGLVELHTGYDFRFGRDREGSISELEALGAERGFHVLQVPALVEDGVPISSSRIRAALRRGDVGSIASWTGRPHALEGTVVRGRGEGARLLVPTANLRSDPRVLLPANGVYVVEVDVRGRLFGGVMNIGTRPTLTDGSRPVPEVHIFDWEGDLVGEALQVFVLRRLRPETRFPGLAELKSAVQADMAEAQRWLRRSPEAAGDRRPGGVLRSRG